jgi:predicted RNase H-like nuclease (RuvC/YqgF family)
MTDTTTRTERKKQLGQSIKQLQGQLTALERQYNTICREEYLEEQHARKVATEEALFQLRKRLRDTETIKKLLEAQPPSHLGKIRGLDVISWLVNTLKMYENIKGTHDRITIWSLSGGEQNSLFQTIQDLIKEIRQERKQAWLANHAPGTKRV